MSLGSFILTAPAVSVRGNDIDTDRIIPARFVKTLTFDHLGQHVFADDRAQQENQPHPLDDPVFAQAQILFVNQNFGCGSSREHAPQAIMRWGRGIKAIVGESFADIFFANCKALGLLCPTVSTETMQDLMRINEAQPDHLFTIDLSQMTIQAGEHTVGITLPEGLRQQFLQGRQDPLLELLEARTEITATAAKLPYFNHWS